MILEKLKNYYKLLRQVNWIGFVRINLFKKYSGWFMPCRRGYCSIHRKSEIIVKDNSKFFFNRGEQSDPFAGYFKMERGAKLIVSGNFNIHTGGRILIYKNATLELGGGYINHNVFLVCRDRVTIGKGVAISNNVVIRDNDAHELADSQHASMKPIEIGDHVWIGTNVTVLKGVKIGNGAVIAANSLVNKDIPEKALAGGVPAKILRENVEWK